MIEKGSKSGRFADPLVQSIRSNWVVVTLAAVFILALAVLLPSFFQSSNLLNVGRQSAIVGVVAIGMTFVILTGGIDLSVGSILALSGVTMAMLVNDGWMIGSAILVALAAGLVVGAVNGIGVAVLKIQPFIMTLATMVAVAGLSLRVTKGGPQQFNNSDFTFQLLGSGGVFGIPGPFVIFAAVAAIGILVLRNLTFGRFLYAIGGSIEAARLSGVRTTRALVIAYAISGLTAALAGVMTASRIGTGDPTAGNLANLDAITAVVIGGTSLMGGVGGAVGTVFGALLLAVLSNVMNLVGISPFDQQIVKGAVIVVAVLLAVNAARRRLNRRAASGDRFLGAVTTKTAKTMGPVPS
ncbi:Ribose import permease protein RbsC [Mycolicibacterium mageritense]|uniref:Ribose import permease protein RbsC n=1 Tax=Mycolicibacterium mageritense TaxID=53462 RepID=A0AAI8XNW3_MYCME|nr:Ribose import permease protein RbsC [Mycolicibacterium mageritense]